MPRDRSVVQGKSIEDILNMDVNALNKLGLSDMKQVVGRLVSAGNKRLRSFEKLEEGSPATRYVYRSGGVFSTKGKDLNALRAEYVRAKGFLQSQTGTVKGWKATRTQTIKALHEQGVDVTKEQFNNLWMIYERLKEVSPEISTKALKYAVLDEISNRLEDNNQPPDKILSQLIERLTEIYEQRAELEDDGSGVSGFFEI